MKYIISLLFGVFISCLSLYANDSTPSQITFTAYSSDSITQIGQRINIRFELTVKNGTDLFDPEEFKAPDFKGFNILYGPSQSQSSSVNIINGVKTESRSIIYTYVLETVKTGTFSISSANVKVGSNSIKSNSLKIKVLSEKNYEKEMEELTKIETEFDVIAPDSVEAGRPFRIIFEINAADAADFKSPSFDDFLVLSGPSVSTSTGITVINGRRVRIVKKSFTYIVKAEKEGEFKIKPANITVGNKKYKTKQTSIKVVPEFKRKTPDRPGRIEKPEGTFI